MSRRDVFGTYTKDDVDKTEDQMGGGSEWIKFPERQTVVIRILPPLAGEDLPWVNVWQHFVKVPGGKTVIFNCPLKMKNQRCPACEKEARLRSTGNPQDEKLAKDFSPSYRAIARAIDRGSPELGVRPVGIGKTVMARLNHFRKKLDKEFTDPDKGYDLAIEFLGKQPWYQVDLAEQCPLARTDEGFDDVVGQAKALALAPFAKVISYDDIVEKFSEQPAVKSAPPSRAALGSGVNDVNSDNEPF